MQSRPKEYYIRQFPFVIGVLACVKIFLVYHYFMLVSVCSYTNLSSKKYVHAIGEFVYRLCSVHPNKRYCCLLYKIVPGFVGML